MSEAEDRAAIGELLELAMSGKGPTYTLTAYEAWLVLSSIQLTVTHAGIGSIMADHLRTIGQAIQRLYSGELAELAERGWHREFDRPSRRGR